MSVTQYNIAPPEEKNQLYLFDFSIFYLVWVCMYIHDVYGHSQTTLHLWKSESFKKLVLYIQSTILSVLGGPNSARAEHFCCPNLNFKRLKY